MTYSFSFKGIRLIFWTYPLELSLALFAGILASLLSSWNQWEHPFLLHFILLSPFYFAIIYLSNIHQLGYKVSWLYPILCTAIFGYWNFIEHHTIPLVGFCLIHALLFFTKGFEPDNRKFTHLAIVTIANTVFSGILSGALWLIVFGILGGIEFLFGISLFGYKIYENIPIFIGIFFTAFFFLILENRTAPYDSKQAGLLFAGDILINWILSPAVIIYTAMVYIYLAKILLQFELPEGQVATVILPYLALGLFCIALRQFSEKPKWQWFYCYFARLSLLPLGLLWQGIYVRVTDYGLTEARIYLIAVAVLVTLFMLLSLFQKTLQYRLFSILTMIMIIVVTMVLNPIKLEEESQNREFFKIMQQYNLLDEDGQIHQDVLNGKQKLELSIKDAARVSHISTRLSDEKLEFYGIEQLHRLRDLLREPGRDDKDKYDELPTQYYFHRFDYQLIDVQPYREFFFTPHASLLAPVDSDSNLIEVYLSTVDYEKMDLVVHQQSVLTVLQQNGIENGKLYPASELEPIVKKLQLLPTIDGKLLLLLNINLDYSETHKHYILTGGKLLGYFNQ